MFGSGLQSQGYSNTWFAEQAGSSYAGEGSQSVQGVAQFDERAFEDAFAAAQKDLDLQAKNHEELSASGIGQIIDSIGLGQEEVLASTTSNVEQATDATTKSHLDSRMESKAQWAMRNEVDQIPSRTPEMEEFQREMHEHPESEQKEKNSAADDRDALAATAGQLLESVKDDTSAKFQGSQFLALMRKLRDKEVVVEGDKMVEADTRTGNAVSQTPLPDISALSSPSSVSLQSHRDFSVSVSATSTAPTTATQSPAVQTPSVTESNFLTTKISQHFDTSLYADSFPYEDTNSDADAW